MTNNKFTYVKPSIEGQWNTNKPSNEAPNCS